MLESEKKESGNNERVDTIEKANAMRSKATETHDIGDFHVVIVQPSNTHGEIKMNTKR